MALTVTHKRGDTFQFSAVLKETRTGPVMDLTGWAINSMVRALDGSLIATLSVLIDDPETGAYVLTAESTETWPVGAACWDIQYTDANLVIRSTETLSLKIIEDVTYEDVV